METINKILEWIRDTDQNPEGLKINFRHDHWCKIFEDKENCDCTPDVYIGENKIEWQGLIETD